MERLIPLFARGYRVNQKVNELVEAVEALQEAPGTPGADGADLGPSAGDTAFEAGEYATFVAPGIMRPLAVFTGEETLPVAGDTIQIGNVTFEITSGGSPAEGNVAIDLLTGAWGGPIGDVATLMLHILILFNQQAGHSPVIIGWSGGSSISAFAQYAGYTSLWGDPISVAATWGSWSSDTIALQLSVQGMISHLANLLDQAGNRCIIPLPPYVCLYGVIQSPNEAGTATLNVAIATASKQADVVEWKFVGKHANTADLKQISVTVAGQTPIVFDLPTNSAGGWELDITGWISSFTDETKTAEFAVVFRTSAGIEVENIFAADISSSYSATSRRANLTAEVAAVLIGTPSTGDVDLRLIKSASLPYANPYPLPENGTARI